MTAARVGLPLRRGSRTPRSSPSPSSPQAVYAGTSGTLRPGGVFRSLDRGATWEPLRQGFSTALVEEIAVDPSDPDLLYASAGQLGLFKSADGGASWSVLDLGIPLGAVIDIPSLVIDPARSSTIYAACRMNGPLLRSDDQGGHGRPSAIRP